MGHGLHRCEHMESLETRQLLGRTLSAILPVLIQRQLGGRWSRGIKAASAIKDDKRSSQDIRDCLGVGREEI